MGWRLFARGRLPGPVAAKRHGPGLPRLNLCFIVAALACSFGLPRQLAGDGGAGNGDREGDAAGISGSDSSDTVGDEAEGNETRHEAAASVRDH